MLKKTMTLFVILGVLSLTACSYGLTPNSVSESPSGSEESPAATSESDHNSALPEEELSFAPIDDIMSKMDATNLYELRMVDEHIGYVLGINQNHTQKSADGELIPEAVLARFDFKTGEITVVHRKNQPAAWFYRMQAAKQPDGTEVVFDGQTICTVVNGSVKDSFSLPEALTGNPAAIYDADYHIGTDYFAYVAPDTKDLFVKNFKTGDTSTPFPAVDSGKQHAYAPLFSLGGDQLLFFKGGKNSGEYDSIIGLNMKGDKLFETEKPKRLAFETFPGWLEDDFYTMQATDSSTDTKSGLVTYFTLYDKSGSVNRNLILDCKLSALQRYSSSEAGLCFTALVKEEPEGKSLFSYAVGLLNLRLGQAYFVQRSDIRIISCDLSPSGSVLAWLEDEHIRAIPLADAPREPVSVAVN